jgi:hypothetical protein
MDGLVTALSPPIQPRYGAEADSVGEESLGHDKQTAGLEMRNGLFVEKPVAFPTESVVSEVRKT